MFLLCGGKKDVIVDQQLPVSHRAVKVISCPDPLVKYCQRVNADLYHPEINPQGYVDLGLAENKLCEDLTTDKFRSLEISKTEETSLQYYPNLRGLLSFRVVLARFIQKRFNVRMTVEPDELIVASGTTAILDTLAFAIADPGEYIMVPAPYYYRIFNDLMDQAGVHVLEVPLSSKNGFELTINSFEIVYSIACKQGKKVRGILLISPNNPLGDVYSEKILSECLLFAAKNKLHVICDEIYAMSIFDEDTKFTSILSIPMPDPERVHFVWGVSKDIGLSGYRCGVLYTKNKHVIRFATSMGLFHLTPPLIQRRLELVLADARTDTLMRALKFIKNRTKHQWFPHIVTLLQRPVKDCQAVINPDWLDHIYFPLYIKRLSSVYNAAAAKLLSMGVKVHPSKAGIFIWADFSSFLPEITFAAEHRLFECFLDAHVYVLPGKQNYCPQPGWFRIIIASDPKQVMEGLNRIEKVLSTVKVTSNGTIKSE